MSVSFSRLRRITLACLALASSALAAPALYAADWPTKPIQLVIPYPPGGSADLLARPLAAQLQQQMGQSVILEYKPGAGGTLASQYVARAKPDGYTVLMVLAAHAINDSLYPKLPYDTRKDFAPISLVANLPMVIGGSNKLPARTVPELVRAAQADSGKLTFGSAGNGNTGHLAAELFASAAGIRMTHVPYKGSAGVVNAMLAKYSAAKWPVLPLPADPKLNLPGLALAAWMSSWMFLTGNLPLAATIMGRLATRDTGAKSLRVS